MTDKIKIAVFVSGGGTNLQALIDAQNSGIIKSGEISLVISNKEGVYALERAAKANIKSVVVLKNEGQDVFEEKIVHILEENNIGLIVLAGFLSILSEKFTSKYDKRIINVHPSLIPSFCGKGYYGLKVHEEALKYGVKVTGATVHFVNEIPDGGKIRGTTVGITGSTYVPPIPFEYQVKEDIDNILSSNIEDIDKAIELCLYVMKTQIYNDGNKRTAVIFANHYLISKGKGLLVIDFNKVNQFRKLLVSYYEGKDLLTIKDFLKNCWLTF